MNTQFKNNVLTVLTGITKESIDKGISDLVARDEKGNAQYRVAVNDDGKGGLDVYGLTVNAFIDGRAAVVIVLPAAVTQADVQKQYGEALLAAHKYTDIIAAAASDKEAQIAALFTDAE